MKVLHTNCDYIWTPLHQTMIKNLDAIGVYNEVFSPVYTTNGSGMILSEREHVSPCFRKADRFFFHVKQFKIIKEFNRIFSVNGKNSIKTFDVLHSYYLFTDGNYTRKMSKKFGVPYVVAIRNTDVNAFFKYMPHLRYVGISVMKDAERVFFLSDSYRDQVIYKYVPRKLRNHILGKSVVIPNGIDGFWLENKFFERNYKDVLDRMQRRDIRLICVGRIDKNKNIELTLRTIRRFRNEGWKVHLDVIGPIADKSIFEKIRLEKDVTFFDFLPKEQLIDLFRQADIFVMPSHKETFGLVYAEAMSQGLPVIYTKGQGFDRQFEEGVVGFSVDDHSVNDLKEKIINIISDYERISKNCLNRVEKFNWKDIVQLYYSIYEDIIR